MTIDCMSRTVVGSGLKCQEFRGRRGFEERQPAAKTETAFLPVTITDAVDHRAEVPASKPAPVIVERSAPGIEVELVGGRRVRFDRDTDPEVVRRLVILLEGEGR